MNLRGAGTAQNRRRPLLVSQFLRLPLLALLLLPHFSEEQKKRDATKDLLLDVCATCHANATCMKKDGKDTCECNYGFIGNGRTFCHDKNECLSGICGENALCHNTQGSYYCVCLEGFQASNKHEIFIPNDGTKCIVVDCGSPPTVPNAHSAPVYKTTYGHQVVYTCQPGYIVASGNMTAVCNSRGQWEGADIVCKEIACGQPPVVSFSNIIWNGATQPGSIAKYDCMKGFYPISTKRHSVCTKNGSWERLDLRCEKVEDFINVTWKDPCLTWRRHYGSAGVNETYQVTAWMLGNESNKTADLLINPPAIEAAVNVCLQLYQHANYTIEVNADSINLLLRISIIRPVMYPIVEKKFVFNNISIYNDTCIKWQRVPRRGLSKETYVVRLEGLRWYQKEFSHNMNLSFITDSWNPELCLNLSSGSNYTVNISTANLDHNVLVHLSIPIADPPSPEVEFMSVEGFIPSFSFVKAKGRNGPISSYQVIVIPEDPSCDYNCYSLTSQTYFSKGSESASYVAAEFPVEIIPENVLNFVLGDRLYYGGFYNAPLKSKREYCVILRTVSKWNGVKTQSCVIWAQIRDISFPLQHLSIVILSSVAATCSILLLLLCVACSTYNTS